jgi:hypothetical protein
VADVARLTTGIIQSTPAGKHRTFRIPGISKEVPNIWLLANLIGNLPDPLHTKVHNSATMILETGAKFGEPAPMVNFHLSHQKKIQFFSIMYKNLFRKKNIKN